MVTQEETSSPLLVTLPFMSTMGRSIEFGATGKLLTLKSASMLYLAPAHG